MDKLMGGKNAINRRFYKVAHSHISNGESVLNFGCGSRFVFEKYLQVTKKDVKVTSVDIQKIKNVPKYVHKYVQKSVEEKIKLSKKFDVVTFFELIEHIDKTDELLNNCRNNLKRGGALVFSLPNLSSIYARAELLLGFQPHVLEVSNKCSNFGTGKFGEMNNPSNTPVHHMRGITTKAMKEMLEYYRFDVMKIIGYNHHRGLGQLLSLIPSFAPVNIFVCKKR